MMLLGSNGIFQRWIAVGGALVTGEKVYRTFILSFSLLTLLCFGHEISSLDRSHTPTMMCVLISILEYCNSRSWTRTFDVSMDQDAALSLLVRSHNFIVGKVMSSSWPLWWQYVYMPTCHKVYLVMLLLLLWEVLYFT